MKSFRFDLFPVSFKKKKIIILSYNIKELWYLPLFDRKWGLSVIDATMSIGPSLCSITDETHFLSN